METKDSFNCILCIMLFVFTIAAGKAHYAHPHDGWGFCLFGLFWLGLLLGLKINEDYSDD